MSRRQQNQGFSSTRYTRQGPVTGNNAQSTSFVQGSLSKKENTFSKMNKQNTMLYLHQHSSNMQNQPAKNVGSFCAGHRQSEPLVRPMTATQNGQHPLQEVHDLENRSSHMNITHSLGRKRQSTKVDSNSRISSQETHNMPESTAHFKTSKQAQTQRFPAPKATVQPNGPSLSYLNSTSVPIVVNQEVEFHNAVMAVDSIEKRQGTEIDRENIHVNEQYGVDIRQYMKHLETIQPVNDCLTGHKVTGNLRGKMVDWMIEVLTNFKCDDQTYFLAVSLMDRYFKGKHEITETSDLHLIGVTCMFVASKYEDILPLKMKMIYEKIAHKKLAIDRIKTTELDILKTISYRIPMPTSIEFLKVYLKDVLDITYQKQVYCSSKSEAAEAAQTLPQCPKEIERLLVARLSIYLAKMALHDYELCGRRPSLQAIGALYVAMKITEQLKKVQLITNDLVVKMARAAEVREEEIIDVSQRVLFLAQNFEKAFSGLENLKKTHFVNITSLL